MCHPVEFCKVNRHACLPSPTLGDVSQVAQTETTTAAAATRAPRLAVGGPDHDGKTPRLWGILNVVPAAHNDRGSRLQFVFSC